MLLQLPDTIIYTLGLQKVVLVSLVDPFLVFIRETLGSLVLPAKTHALLIAFFNNFGADRTQYRGHFVTQEQTAKRLDSKVIMSQNTLFLRSSKKIFVLQLISFAFVFVACLLYFFVVALEVVVVVFPSRF